MSLFSPFTVRGVTLPNRVVISPMSQYSARDGLADDWHLVHLGRFALGGAGLVFTEATGVEARGRRTHGDLGLWHDGQIEGLARIARFVQAQGAVAGIQLGHAGRKASERRPWHGWTPVNDEDAETRGETPWPVIGPTDEPYADGWHVPAAMTIEDIDTVKTAFRDAARRAHQAGFDVIEVYAAHGFLLHQFYSPVCNTRTDAYGGSFDGRIRLSLEVADAIRSVWPDDRPVFFRVSATDWVDGGWESEDTVALARRLKDHGVDVIDCSTGGIGGPHKTRRMPLAPAYQAPFAEAVRRDAGIAAMTVGFVWDAALADQIVGEGKVDLVALAREALNNPNWALHAAQTLNADPTFAMWKPQFGWWLEKRYRVLRKLGLLTGPGESPPAVSPLPETTR